MTNNIKSIQDRVVERAVQEYVAQAEKAKTNFFHDLEHETFKLQSTSGVSFYDDGRELSLVFAVDKIIDAAIATTAPYIANVACEKFIDQVEALQQHSKKK
jgi:hypothetical protein